MNFAELLNLASYDHLRTVAAMLHLRKRGDDRQHWILTIHQFWFAPDSGVAQLSTLSLPACRALWRLLQTPQLPAHLFLADFGPLQPAGRRRTLENETPPVASKRKSASLIHSPAQELYAMGLLFGVEGKAVDRAQWLIIPDDLRQPIANWLDLQLLRWQTPSAAASANLAFSPSPFMLLHDLIQLLAFARQKPAALGAGKRFPLQADWQQLQPRLLLLQQAAFAPDPLAQGADWLRFLLFLAEAGGLLANGLPQPFLWQWLRLPVDEQLRHVWQGWLTASDPLCTRFRRVPLAGVAGWLDAWGGLGKDGNPDFAAADLAHALIALPNTLPQAYLHWFASLQALDQQLDLLLAALCQWGVVEQVGRQPSPFLRPVDAESGLERADSQLEMRYRLRRLGALLLQLQPVTAFAEPSAPLIDLRWKGGSGQWLSSAFLALEEDRLEADGTSASSATPATVWSMHQRSDGDPESLLLLAPFCASIVLQPATLLTLSESANAQDHWLHHLQISERSLALAASQGYGEADIWQFVQQSGVQQSGIQQGGSQPWAQPSPVDWQWLQRGLRLGKQLALQPALLLVSKDASLMQQIQQNRHLRDKLGAMLTPTVTIWQGDATGEITGDTVRWAETLRAEGFFVADADDVANAGERHRSDASHPLADKLCLNGEDAAVLWLALQLYASMGRYAALPLRPTPETLHQLFNSLSFQQQASLTSQLGQMEAALASAIDQLPFAPPRAPSDPAQWRPLIEQAIDRKVDLDMLHWSAGRNLSVRRRVTPFYIEENRFGSPALRGWCHHSGNDLWFRLDRIVDLMHIQPDGRDIYSQPDGHGL